MEEEVIVLITAVGNRTFTTPADIKPNSNTRIELWGGGGAGGYVLGNNSVSSGGAGGTYVACSVTLAAGRVNPIVVGGGGYGMSYRVDGTGDPGGDTTFDGGSGILVIRAQGGAGAVPILTDNVLQSTHIPAGSTANSRVVGSSTVMYKGGDGGRSLSDGESGGGGGGAGSSANGVSASGRTGGTTTFAYGGSGGNGTLTTASNGVNGAVRSGGGSGASSYGVSGPRPSGNGAPGQVRITYTRILPTTKPFIMKSFI